MNVCRSTVRKEGISALFKGMGPPLASAAMINAVTFATYAQANNVSELSHYNYHQLL
jgi:uncharacterized membrane protein YdfJ with MMPL/SSD domain